MNPTATGRAALLMGALSLATCAAWAQALPDANAVARYAQALLDEQGIDPQGPGLTLLVARGDTLLLLNADAWLETGALQRLHDRMQREDRLALVAPTLLYPDGRQQFVWSPERGVAGEALQQVRNRFEGRRWAHGSALRALSRMVGRLWYTAACVLVRTEAFHAVGGFDRGFFMYFEDVDLCVRLEDAGWRLGQEPAAVVRHSGGFTRHPHVDDVYRPSQLRYYALHRPPWEARLVERRLRRRYGDEAVDGWLRQDGRS